MLTVESYWTAVKERSVENALLIREGSKVKGASFWMMEVLVARVPFPVATDTTSERRCQPWSFGSLDRCLFLPVAAVFMKTSEYQTSAATSATM